MHNTFIKFNSSLIIFCFPSKTSLELTANHILLNISDIEHRAKMPFGNDQKPMFKILKKNLIRCMRSRFLQDTTTHVQNISKY